MAKKSLSKARPNSPVEPPLPKEGGERRVVVALGDTHGRAYWKEIVAQESDADKIIFVGDYFDSFSIPGDVQIQNFKEILELKRSHRKQVVLLMGNHEYHYLPGLGERYSGFQDEYKNQIGALVFTSLKNDLMQVMYQEDGTLFSHAGITKTWAKDYDINKTNVARSVNELFKRRPTAFLYDRHDRSGYGDAICQSPIWVRPDALMTDMLEGFTQVVGHTHSEHIIYHEPEKLIQIDTLEFGANEYLKLIDGVPVTRKI